MNAVDGLALLVIAVTLTVAGSLGVAVRDVVMSIAAFTLARSIPGFQPRPVSEIHHSRGISAPLAGCE